MTRPITRRTAEPLTPLELEIMKVLWETGPASVQTVQEALAAERKLAYNTVQTMLNVLLRKGKVKRQIQGRAYLYEPLVSRPQTARLAVSDLVHRMFDGSAESLVLSLVEARQLTPEKLAELSALLEQSEENDQEDPHGKN
jgi:predicted transcriptional regulator